MINFDSIKDRLDSHLISVDELIVFDRIILDTCINHIENLNSNLRTGPFKIDNPSYLAEKTLTALKNVRNNDSLRIHYLSMFNSCLVLQVSYFTSILDDIFHHTANYLFVSNIKPDFTKEFLSQKNDINFQNMASTVKAFKKYLDIKIEANSIFNTIILAQSARHAIVHSLGKADQKFINHVANAIPRDIKKELILNQKIQFSQSELDFVKTAMQVFVDELCDSITARYGSI